MIIVKVTYTVKQEFSSQNQENINLFLKDFQQMNNDDFQYTVYLLENGKTFVHLSHYKNEEIQKALLAVESFKSFQKQRDDNGLEKKPQIEVMKMIGSSKDKFFKN
jgi:hypothetical protein